MQTLRIYLTLLVTAMLTVSASGQDWPADLNPVAFEKPPSHAPVVLVKDGKPLGSIVMTDGAPGGAATQLQFFIEKATGAKLPIVKGKIEPPAIVLGDNAMAAKLGLVGKHMPAEGFAIRTAPGLVFIVGHNAGRNANGTG